MSTDKFVEAIEQSMKSGYIRMLILLALEKEHANGYKLMKMISEDTFGEWRPTNSTMYPYLSDLADKRLIQFKIKKQGERESKEYSLTTKGRKILKKLVEKQQEMNISLLSMMSVITDIDILPSKLLEFIKQSLHDRILMGKPDKKKIEILSKRIEIFAIILDLVGKNKVEMEKELEILKSKKTEK